MNTMEEKKVERAAIILSHVYPPIPDRSCDWSAWFGRDGEEAGRYGYGATRVEAVRDLIDNHADDREQALRDTLDTCHAWVSHWLRDAESGLGPTETSLRDVLAIIEAAKAGAAQ